jgi:hypothetical protein
MPANHVTVDADASEFLEAVSSLTELLERLRQLVHGFVDVSELSFELASIDLRDDAALGAVNLRAVFKPSDRLLRLVAALRACERELLVAKELTHA